MTFRLFVLVISMMVNVAWLTSARAHPHEFVEMKINVLFGADGKATGMRYFWRFDEFFSVYALETAPVGSDGKTTQAGLDATLAEILTNITKIGFFTRFDENSGLVPEFGTAVAKGAALNKRQLEIVFEIPFKKPVPLTGKGMTYAVYDPEFYIAMNYSTDKDAVILTNAPKGCTSKIEEADPSDDVKDLASSLGRSESAQMDLGISFAEWVKVSCR